MKQASLLTNKIIEYLTVQGHKAWRQVNTPVRNRKGVVHRGVGDILGVLRPHGRHIEVEVKIDKDKQSPDQKKHMEDVRERGGVYIIAKDFDTFCNDYMKVIYGKH